MIFVVDYAEANLGTENLSPAEMTEKDDGGNTTTQEENDTSSHLLGTGSVSFSIECNLCSLLQFFSLCFNWI